MATGGGAAIRPRAHADPLQDACLPRRPPLPLRAGGGGQGLANNCVRLSSWARGAPAAHLPPPHSSLLFASPSLPPARTLPVNIPPPPFLPPLLLPSLPDSLMPPSLPPRPLPSPALQKRLYREVLGIYMASRDHAGLIDACIRLGDASQGGDPQLWTEVLAYFASQPGDGCAAQLKVRPPYHPSFPPLPASGLPGRSSWPGVVLLCGFLCIGVSANGRCTPLHRAVWSSQQGTSKFTGFPWAIQCR